MIAFRRARAAHVNAKDGVTKGGEKIASGIGEREKPRERRFELLRAPIACGGKQHGDFGFGRKSAREVDVNGETSPDCAWGCTTSARWSLCIGAIEGEWWMGKSFGMKNDECGIRN